MFNAFANAVLRALMSIVLRLRVHQIERVPLTGPMIVVANHISLVDPPLIGAIMPRMVVFMAKREVLKTPVLGMLAAWYGAFGVRRGEGDPGAIRAALAVLERGGALGMFPEGTRSKNGRLQPGRPGAAMLALRTGAMLLPVGIAGTEQITSPLALLRRPVVEVNVGEPFRLQEGAPIDTNAATALIMTRIAELLPERYQSASYAISSQRRSVGPKLDEEFAARSRGAIDE